MTLTPDQVRQQVEKVMESRGGAGFAFAPRLVQEGLGTGFAELDAALQGGFPRVGMTEIVGTRSSGRTTLATAYVAERTREGQVCAWVDVSGEMTPEAFMADGGDLERMLWMRCLEQTEQITEVTEERQRDARIKAELQVVNYAKDKTAGTPGVKNRVLGEVRKIQVSSDRLPKRRGEIVLKKNTIPEAARAKAIPAFRRPEAARGVKKPWGRLEQAIKAVDLLVQGGGFGTIVMDLGGIRPEFVKKIPLVTWFRWRAALERTRTGLLVLSHAGCVGSSAEMMVRVEGEVPETGTVMLGMVYRLEVVRRRFEAEIVGRRKDVSLASAWESKAGWANCG